MRILIIVDSYYPRLKIVGLQLYNLACSLKKMGHDAEFLAIGRDGDIGWKVEGDARVFCIQPDIRLKLIERSEKEEFGKTERRLFELFGRAISRTGKVLHIARYPLASLGMAKRLARKALELHESDPYDAVIGTYWPAECAYAALMFKKKMPNVLTYLYEGDLFPPPNVGVLPMALQRIISRNWYKTMYGGFDKVFQLPVAGTHNPEEINKEYRTVLDCLGLPLLVDIGGNCRMPEKHLLEEGVENWVYAGSLNNELYSPKAAVDSFLSLPADKNRKLYIVGAGIGDDPAIEYCQNAQKKNPDKIKVLGYVDKETLQGILKSADVLVSMKSAPRLSGKIFEYMGYSKPIVHFSSCDDDPDIDYLVKYPLSVIVDATIGFESEWAEAARRGVEKVLGRTAWDGKNELEEFTPDFSARRLVECIAEKKEDYAR